MNDEHEQLLRDKYSDLIDRHQNLKERANEADQEEYPLHDPSEIRAEADGVLEGVQAIEAVLNEIDADD